MNQAELAELVGLLKTGERLARTEVKVDTLADEVRLLRLEQRESRDLMQSLNVQVGSVCTQITDLHRVTEDTHSTVANGSSKGVVSGKVQVGATTMALATVIALILERLVF